MPFMGKYSLLLAFYQQCSLRLADTTEILCWCFKHPQYSSGIFTVTLSVTISSVSSVLAPAVRGQASINRAWRLNYPALVSSPLMMFGVFVLLDIFRALILLCKNDVDSRVVKMGKGV